MNALPPKPSFLLTAAVCAVSTATALAQPGKPPEPLALIHANVLDVRTGRIAAHQTVLLRSGKIESVSGAPAAAGIKTVDLGNRGDVIGIRQT